MIPCRISHTQFPFQFEKLPFEPLLTHPIAGAPIVLDALDQCGSANERNILLLCLSPFVSAFSSSSAVRRFIDSHDPRQHLHILLRCDIRTYAKPCMKTIGLVQTIYSL
jgi:hypothetical protein